jgi:hypothetical protein
MLACYFFTVETISLRRFFVLFFIELANRRVHLAGCTTNSNGAWVTQQARNLSFTGLFERVRFLIHDRDSKFAAAFDEVFRSEGIQVIHTPIRAPQAADSRCSRPTRSRLVGVSERANACLSSASVKPLHAAARWYSWISPPSRSRRLISSPGNNGSAFVKST